MTPVALAIHTDGAVSCGARLWQFRGRLQLTVVVKAVFAIVPDGVATPAGPGEIVVDDRYRGGHPIHSVEAANDLAPYLKRCDVLFVGHAHAPGVPAAAVRLGLSRDGQRLLDKTIHVYGDRGPSGAREPFTRMPIVYERAIGRMGAPNPIGTDSPNLADPRDPQRPAGFGPIGRHWPVRRLLLGKIEGKAIDAAIAEIPEAMPWDYFQAAPPDQQIEHLRGGEWLVLDGLHPTLARVQTRLAAVRGAARVVLRRPGAPAAEQAPELACDTLAIDGDRQTLSLSWRGRCEVPDGEATLPSLVIVAALEAPGVPVDWAKLVAGARPPSAAPPALVASLMSTSADFGAPKAPALPFAKDASSASVLSRLPPSPALPRRSKETMALSLDQLPPLPGSVLPFAPPEAPSPNPQARAPAEISGAPWSAAPAQPVPRSEEDPVTAELEPLHPSELFAPALHPPPAVIPTPVPAPLPAMTPPPAIAVPHSTPPPPPADPWAQTAPRPPEPEPMRPAQSPAAFERPAAAAVKGSFYSRFKK